MTDIKIRNLDEETLERLRMRAAQDGVSVEEEATLFLHDALKPRLRLGDLAVQLFGPDNGIELTLEKR